MKTSKEKQKKYQKKNAKLSRPKVFVKKNYRAENFSLKNYYLILRESSAESNESLASNQTSESVVSVKI